ncbi:hypothetical protein quinque_008280 [Culex quinquefasciatus]
MDLTPANEVRCNGPCRKWFHPATVNLDQIVADLLRTSSGKSSGLWWFCPECRQTVDLPLHYVTDLPTELLIMIFQHLDVDSLLEVRSTCHRWKDVVDQSNSLRKEFVVAFKRKVTMDETFQPENLLPASRTRLNHSKIICVETWWPAFGAALTELTLYHCEIGLSVLLGMLREAPNLISLSLYGIEYSSVEEIEANFRLEKLEVLSCNRLFDIFRRIFPRLRVMDLAFDVSGEEGVTACRLLRSVQGTLKELECNFTQFMLEQIASMDQLQLTNIADRGEENLAVQLSLMQPLVRVLSLTATNEVLTEIGRNLKNLHQISVTIAEDQSYFEPSFLAEMTELTSLSLSGQDRRYSSFKGFQSTNLSYLRLDAIYFIDSSLRNFLTSCPNLQTLEILDCQLASWSDIFAARLQSLRSLSLWNNRVRNYVMKISEKLTTLKELDISECQILPEKLVKLILQCPQLEKLTLDSIKTVDDEFVSNLDQFPQLKELDIGDCPITDKSVEFIAENCSNLNVSINCEQVSSVAKKLLEQVTSLR